MLITTSSVVAIRCSECGALDFHLLSLFSFNSKKSITIDCECGNSLVSIGTKDRKTFWIQINCLMCEAHHLTYNNRRFIWSDEVLSVRCEETGVDIGFIGPKELVKTHVQNQDKSLREMAEEMGFEEYFECPDVMYEVLDYLYEFAENDKLYCECGNYQIDTDVYPDRLELHCDDCDCQVVISAESEKDISAIKDSSEIKLTSGGIINISKKGKLKRKKHQKK